MEKNIFPVSRHKKLLVNNLKRYSVLVTTFIPLFQLIVLRDLLNSRSCSFVNGFQNVDLRILDPYSSYLRSRGFEDESCKRK